MIDPESLMTDEGPALLLATDPLTNSHGQVQAIHFLDDVFGVNILGLSEFRTMVTPQEFDWRCIARPNLFDDVRERMMAECF